MIALNLKEVNEILRCLLNHSDEEELIGKLIREQKRLKQTVGESDGTDNKINGGS
jgi:hypothetical protein